MSFYGRLPEDLRRIHEPLYDGRGLPKISGAVALAGGDRVSMLCWRQGMGNCSGSVRLCLMRLQPVHNRRDDLRAHAQTFDHVVPRDVVCDKPEDGSQCAGPATGVGAWQLLHLVDLVAQAQAGNGQAR